ncbi:GNS1/SUR4 family protein [Ancylostoma ceylanicum]|uniref:Elongation of very long chain fatty acids protein n=1 Tax=Ancylostoma ceylanicum TaxID=53326 RepID=A0A0D6M2M4_9BILA|nr:GNS1/SUR4 family protein [Ancylostoma ceylanicum]
MPSFLEVATASPFSYEDAKSYTRSFERTAFIISMVYVVVIFSIKAIMSNFKPFQLTAALNFWNAWLAIFSTIGSFITGYGLFYEIYYRGLVCNYYMLRSYGVRVPAWVARNITTMQILQFVITHFILFHVGYLVSQGVKVDSTPKVFWSCLIMEISYVVLFANFYFQSYVKGGGKKFIAEKSKKQE